MTAHVTATRTALTLLAGLLISAGAAHARSPLDGRVRVHNDRHRPVQVTIDGELSARLAPGQTRVLHAVPNGVRFVEIRGAGGRVVERKLAVPVAGLAILEIQALAGTAVVHNDSGVAMRIEVDGRDLGVARQGGRVKAVDLRPGAHRVLARPVGRRSAEAIVQTVIVDAGERSQVRLGDWFAQVEVHNPLDRGAQVFLDGRRVNRARAGRTELLSRIEPGRHLVELRTRRGEVLARSTVTLSPGERERVSPRALQAELQVRNDRRRAVDVLIDGAHRGRVAAGERRIFSDLMPGRHRVTIVGRNGRATHHEVRLARGEREALALAPRGRGHAVARR